MKNHRMPIQPIENNRFVKNRIVSKLLETSNLDLNDIAMMSFTEQERIQFAQLIGYSVSGFGTLSYVDDETYNAAVKMSEGMREADARIEALSEMLDEARRGVKQAAVALFKIHPDDLECDL